MDTKLRRERGKKGSMKDNICEQNSRVKGIS